MNKCSLCGRKMNSANNHFGLNCLKKSCKLLNIKNVKNLKGEKTLNKKVMNTLNKNKLPTKQQSLLTNRYITLKLLEQVNMSCYDNIKDSINKDIQKINFKTTEKDLTTMNTMPLKYANQILTLYLKYNLSDKTLSNAEDFYYKENIAFDTILFGFSSYYNKKPYLSGMLQQIQLLMWKAGILALRDRNYDCSAKLLEHSLQHYPEDITILDDDVIIGKIKGDKNFKDKIKTIVKKYGNTKSFNTNNYNSKEDSDYKSLNYLDSDLTYALNNTTIQVEGRKSGDKWNLDITIIDIYDFTDYKELQEFIEANTLKTIIGLAANNMAMISTSCGLINPYNITIKFSIEY